MSASAPAVSKPAPINELENLKEWDDIVEALRRDAERLETPRPAHTDDTLNAAFASEPIDLPPVVVQPAPPAPAAAPIATPPAQPAGAVPQEEADAGGVDSNGAKRKRKRPAKASPAQDEWGFFDPDQCGFAALIEKLEEIKDKDDTPAPRGA